MATTITQLERQVVELLTYPEGWPGHDACPCKACRFHAGEPTELQPAKPAVLDEEGNVLEAAIEATTELRGYGDCHLAKRVEATVVSFALSDGRAGSVHIEGAAATDQAIVAAIKAWATAHPLDAAVGLGIL